MFKIVRESDIGNNLFDAPEELKVVTINTVGAMGRGIALYVRENYPDAYKAYMKRFREGSLSHTEVWDFETECGVKLAMFPTKIHWRDKSPPGLIQYNVMELQQLVYRGNYKSVAIPPLGLVNGWIRDDATIEDIILYLRRAFMHNEVDAKLYCPDDLYKRIRKIFSVT